MRSNKLLIATAALFTLGMSMPAFSYVERTRTYNGVGAYNASGVYLGVQGGYTRSHYDLDAFLSKDFRKDELAGRAYVGYQINPFLGVESGFTMIAGTELPDNFGDVKTTQLDLLLKVGMPFGDTGLRADLKAGAAHVKWKFDANDVAESVGLNDVSNWKIRPVAGATVSYYLNRNIAIDASYIHVFGDPESSHFGTPTVDLAMLGVSFLFSVS